MKLYGTNTNDIFITKEEEALFKLPVMELIVPDNLEKFKSVLRKISKLRLQRDSFLKAINGKSLKNTKIQENLTSMIQKAEAKIKNSRSTTTGELEALVTEINENVKKITGKMKKNGTDPFISTSAILLYIFLVRVVKYINEETKKLQPDLGDEEKKKVIQKLQMFGKKYIQLREELFLLFELQHVEPPIQSGSVNQANVDQRIEQIVYYHMYKPLTEKSTLENIKNINTSKNVSNQNRMNSNEEIKIEKKTIQENKLISIVFKQEKNGKTTYAIVTKRNHFYYKYKYEVNGNQIISHHPELVEDIESYIEKYKSDIFDYYIKK
jgi:hypothetical protein